MRMCVLLIGAACVCVSVNGKAGLAVASSLCRSLRTCSISPLICTLILTLFLKLKLIITASSGLSRASGSNSSQHNQNVVLFRVVGRREDREELNHKKKLVINRASRISQSVSGSIEVSDTK